MAELTYEEKKQRALEMLGPPNVQPSSADGLDSGWTPESVPGGVAVDMSRPIMHNSDGSFSTERSITIDQDGKFYVIPTIVDGKQRPMKEAVALWRAGKNPTVGVFDNNAAAEDYAVKRSKYLARVRGPDANQGALSYDEKKAQALAALDNKPPPPSGTESFLRGGAEGASLNNEAEIVGAAKALGVEPKGFAAAFAGGPLALATYLGGRVGATAVDAVRNGAAGVVDKYRAGRDTENVKNKAAQEANPGKYLAGQAFGGAASALAAAPASVPGMIGAGIAYGGASELGNSSADLTRGEFKQAAKDTGKGMLVGGALGAGGAVLSRAAEALPGLTTRISKDKTIANLGKYLEGIIKRGGDPEAARKAAGQMMQKGIEAAGDVRVPVDKLDSLAEELAKLPANRRHKIVDDVIESSQRFSKGGATLGELDAELQHWTNTAKDLRVNDPTGARFALKAKDAIKQQIDAISPDLAGAADYLAGRASYAEAKAAGSLLDKLRNAVDPLSEGGAAMSPRKFAALNSGKRKVEIEGWLAKDPEALKAWRMGAEAARVLAKKGDRWIPKAIRDQLPEPALKAAENLLTSFDVTRAFTDPEIAKDVSRLVLPGRQLATEEAVNIISRLTTRLAGDEKAAATLKAAATSAPPSAAQVRIAKRGKTAPPDSFTVDPTNLQDARFQY